jgi:hypothetical protein
VFATIRINQGSYLERNQFILNGVQDVHMCCKNAILSFTILLKCIKWRLIIFILHLLTILRLIVDIYVTTGVFILKLVIILGIIENCK